MTLVVYGDINGDAIINNRDSQKILEGSLSDAQKLAADIVDAGNIADNRDAQRILEFAAGIKKDSLVDSNKIADEVIYQTIAQVVVDPVYTGTNGLWDVVNKGNTDVTLKVECKNSGNVSFSLSNITSDTTTRDLSEGVSVTNISSGKATVKVPRKAGTYSLTLVSGDLSQVITIHVVDVSIVEKSRLAFEDIQAEDRNALTGEIGENTIEVYKDGNRPEMSDFGRSSITFKGNVNNMKGDKKYRVRLKINGDKITNFKIAYVEDDEVITVPYASVPNAENTVLFDLDATKATTKLVVAPEGAVDAQIKAEINEDAEVATVNFESTSILWINKEENKGASRANAVSMGSTVLKNQDLYNGPITKVELDQNDERLVNIGLKISDVKEFSLDRTTLREVTEEGKGEKGKWIGIDLRVINNANGSKYTSTSVTCSDTNIIIDNGRNDNTEVGKAVGYQNAVWVWFKANGVGDTKFTLKFEADGVVEELPVTFRIYDASNASITNVKGYDANGINGIENIKWDEKGNVSFDTFKYAMNSSIDEDDSLERLYTLEFTTNIPVDSLIKCDKINGDSAADWLSIATKTDDYKFTLTLDAESDVPTKFILANKYGKIGKQGSNGHFDVPSDNNRSTITVTPTNKSKVEFWKKENDNGIVSILGLKENAENSSLQGINVEKISVDGEADSQLGDLNSILSSSKKIKVVNNVDEDGLFEVTLNLNSNDVKTVSLNGESGKWILVHMNINNNKINDNTIIDENNDTKTIIIDPKNDDKLLNDVLTYDKNGLRVPVWINLSSPKIKDVTVTGNVSETGSLEVKFGSTSPVEEHNSFLLKIVDSNPIGEDLEVEDPSVVDSSMLDSTDSDGVDLNKAKDLAGDSKLSKEGATNLKDNLELMDEAEIDSHVVDDTVYVTVKANLEKFKNVGDDKVVVPIALDVSPLGKNKGEELSVWGSVSKTWNKGAQDTNDEIYLSIWFRNGDKTKLQNGETVRKEFIVSTGNISCSGTCENTNAALQKVGYNPYIRYVITFIDR